MTKEGWDWGSVGPDLSKLPAHLRENLTESIPLRPGEVYGRVLIFRKTPGLNHPNGRILVSNYHKDAANPSGPPDGAQIDLADFSGRLALSTFFLAKDKVPPVLGGLIRSFLAMGGTEEELRTVIAQAVRPLKLSNPLFPEVPDE